MPRQRAIARRGALYKSERRKVKAPKYFLGRGEGKRGVFHPSSWRVEDKGAAAPTRD
jgi:hypothetical protein